MNKQIPFALALLCALSASPAAWAQNSGISSTPFFSSTLNGDFVTAGASMRQFYGSGETPQTDPFSVTLSSIPAGSTVVAAYANWSYLSPTNTSDPGEATISLDGIDVIGDLAGTGWELCWGQAFGKAYLADVTSLITGNGTYSFSGAVDEPGLASFGEGLSLFVVYENPAEALREVNLYSGYVGNRFDVPAELITLDLATPYSGGSVHFAINALDGQEYYEDTFFVNGVNVGGILPGTGSATNAWQGFIGNDGLNNLNDLAEGDISSFMTLGDTSVSAQTVTPDDCIGHSIAGISHLVVPEPSSLALALLGGVGLLALGRRRPARVR